MEMLFLRVAPGGADWFRFKRRLGQLFFGWLPWVPLHHRFQVALWVAWWLRPFFFLRRRIGAPLSSLDGYREDAFRFVLEQMDGRNLMYLIKVEIEGEPRLLEPGTVILSGHFLLNRLLMRWFVEQGSPAAVVKSVCFPGQRVCGSSALLDTIPVDSMTFVKVRRRLQARQSVLIDLDFPEPRPGYRHLETTAGPRYISPAAFQFAERAGGTIVFASTRLAADGKVLLRVVSPVNFDPAGQLEEFCRFLRTETEQIKR